MRRLIGALLFAGLIGCSNTPTRAPAPMPQLRLAPAALGNELALQQQLEFRHGGRTEYIEALLEVDTNEVRLLLHKAGQIMMRMRWDGVELSEVRAEGLPPELAAERVLADLQLVHWPATNINAALPTGWRLIEREGGRRLQFGEELVISIDYPEAMHARLKQHRYGYELDVRSIAVQP